MSSDPWRTVAVIDTMTGDHGGAIWVLTLECGHTACRPQAAITPTAIFEPIASKLAPRRVRCGSCGLGLSPNPGAIVAALKRTALR